MWWGLWLVPIGNSSERERLLPHLLKAGAPAPLPPVSPVKREREREARDGSVQDRTGHLER